MTTPRATQFGSVTVIASEAVPIKAMQFGAISVQQDAPSISPSRASQFGAIVVIANGKKFVSLRPAIQLPCWQPCTAFGTRSIVVNFG